MNKSKLLKDQLALEIFQMINFLMIKMKLIFVAKRKENNDKHMINHFFN
jgi:hypothetical protein